MKDRLNYMTLKSERTLSLDLKEWADWAQTMWSGRLFQMRVQLIKKEDWWAVVLANGVVRGKEWWWCLLGWGWGLLQLSTNCIVTGAIASYPGCGMRQGIVQSSISDFKNGKAIKLVHISACISRNSTLLHSYLHLHIRKLTLLG